MKLAIVGGSATSTPSLFLTAEMRALENGLEVALIGRSHEHLDAVSRAIALTSGFPQSQLRCTLDRDALAGADIVLLQARYGGYAARARDETFPLKHDMCGDEGLGAGGLAAGFRSWPELANVLCAVRSYCPRAQVLLMTAPLGLLVRCARTAFPDLALAGICELPWVTLRSVCEQTNHTPGEVAFEYAGVNHLGWFDSIRCGLTDVIAEFAQTRDERDFPSRSLVRSSAAIPLKYLALHYRPDDVLAATRSKPCRAHELDRLQTRALSTFASGTAQEIRAALERRPTPWYAHAVAPFIAAFAGMPNSTVFFLSKRNDRYLPSLAPDDIVEVPCAVEDRTVLPLRRQNALAPEKDQILRAFVEYERAAAETIAADRRDRCSGVLAKHPWTRLESLEGLSRDLVDAI